MRRKVILGWFVVATLVGWVNLAQAQVSVDIGIHLGTPPRLVAVPSSPVMYAPSVAGNFFFYARHYYVFRKGVWYMGPRHDGPWAVIEPGFVPRPLLTVPVHYYRMRPPEWKRWHAKAAPRWEPAYGRRWEERREGVREERHEERRR
jgi:hypothetical protein